jgi:hypothetical protein
MIVPSDTSLIAVSYYPTYLNEFVSKIHTLDRRLRFSAAVVVLNNPAISLEGTRAKVHLRYGRASVIEHDNSGREFGGYQAGLDFLNPRVGEAGDYLIVNDTFAIHYEFYSEHFAALKRRICDNVLKHRIAGQVDQHQECLSLGELMSDRWVRSNLMFIDSAALKSIRCRLYVPEVDSWILDTSDPAEFFGDQVGPATRAKLSKWLFEPGGWYGAAPLSIENQRRLCDKARSILQEFYLTMRLNRAGTAVLDLGLSRPEQQRTRIKRKISKLARKLGFDFGPNGDARLPSAF